MSHKVRRKNTTRQQMLIRLCTGFACIGAGIMVQAFENDPKLVAPSNSASAETDPKNGVDEGAVDPNSQNASQKIGGSFQKQGYKDPREELTNERHAFKTPFGQIIWKDVDKRLSYRDKSTFVSYKGFNLKLTIQPELQAGLEKLFRLSETLLGPLLSWNQEPAEFSRWQKRKLMREVPWLMRTQF